jgi:hypothetical protein
MDNHSMTFENRYYLKVYCTASGPSLYCNPAPGSKNNVPAGAPVQ